MLIGDDLERIRTDKGGKAHRDFLMRCLSDTEEDFSRILQMLAVEDPKFFMRIRMDIAKLVLPRQQEFNVNLTLNEDYQELQALANRVPGTKYLPNASVEELQVISETPLTERYDKGQ